MRKGFVSILIPVFNNLPFVRALHQSLLRCTDPDRYELILIDNGSTEEGMPDFYASLTGPSVKVILNGRNLGFGRANNIGYAQSCGEFICLLNSDMLVTPGWMDVLLARFDREPRCDVLQSRIALVGEGPPNEWRTQTCGAVFNDRGLPAYHLANLPICAPQVNTPFELQAFMGTGVTIRREVIEAAGFFDEGFDLVFLEDTDLSLRFSDRGYRIWYEPQSLVYHIHSASMPHLSQEEYDRSRGNNLRRFRSKWPPESISTVMRSLGLSSSP